MARSVRILKATVAHAEALAPLMRPEDAAEVWASGGYPPLDVLLEALNFSDVAYTLFLDGEVAAMWGVGPAMKPTLLAGRWLGVPWLLTGRAVTKHPGAFLRACRACLPLLLQRYPVLVQWVDARYVAAVRWVRWLGFEVGEPVPFGVSGLPFHPVRIRRS